MKKVHISTIKAGDTIVHNGEITTVCGNNIKYSSWFGCNCLFGYSYKSGRELVIKIDDNKLLGHLLSDKVLFAKMLAELN